MVSLATVSAMAQSYNIGEISTSSDFAQKPIPGEKIVTKESIENRVGPGQTNPYKALDMLSSVHTGQVDSYGLSLDQNSFRIRGLYADTFSRLALTLDGVPQVVNVGQGAMGSTIDMENIGYMSLQAGAPSADSGLGFGNNAGSLDMSLIRPKDNFEMSFKQSLGTDEFYRTFIRVDSGKFANGAKMFVSASHSSADKWRGDGDQQRDNIELALTLPIKDVKIEALYAHNDIKRNDYRGLTYAQSQNLDKYYEYDFDTALSGKGGANDKYYYDFNKQHFTEDLVQFELSAPIFGGKFSFKPYYIYTDGYRYASSGQATSQIVKTEMTQNQYGAVAKYEKNILDTDATFGYWYQSIESIPPPTAQKNYTINKNGSLIFSSWGMLNDVGERITHSPFVNLKKKYGDLELTGGIRYLSFKMPEIQGYNLTGLGDISADDAVSRASKNPNMHVNAVTFSEWLPSVALGYKINSQMDLTASYKRGVASPWQGPLWSTFNSNSATFLAKGITLQNIWDKMEMETSDHYDLGLKIKGENWSLEPTVYYVKYDNKQVTAYDPVVKLTYYQSNAKAEGQGVELSGVYAFNSNLQFEGAISYNELNFTQNLTTGGGAKVASDGNQVPDAPKILAKAALNAKIGDYFVIPAVRYVDKRYGDILNKESIDAYTTVDLTFGITKKKLWAFKDVTASINMQNLMNQKYIGIIKNDLDDTASGATTYYQGAPFSAVATISMKF